MGLQKYIILTKKQLMIPVVGTENVVESLIYQGFLPGVCKICVK